MTGAGNSSSIPCWCRDLLGGNSLNWVYSVKVDAQGNSYVSSYTNATDFPVTANAYLTTFVPGSENVAISKLDPQGNLVYSTFLGHSTFGSSDRLAIDAQGSAYLVGTTDGSFPHVAGSYRAQTQTSGGVIVKLSPDGSQVVYSAYLGTVSPEDVAVDAQGRAVIVGETLSDAQIVPPSGVFQSARAGLTDAVVAMVNAAGTGLVYATYLGGPTTDVPYAVALTPAGEATVTGVTGGGFPVTPGAYESAVPGGTAAFVTRLNADGTALVFSTLLGGGQERGAGIAVDQTGNTYVLGYPPSARFPVTPERTSQRPGRCL